MALSITHQFVSAIADAGDATLVQPSNWNDTHTLAGLGTGVETFLETPSSANLAAAVTGETGTGALVFATAPVFPTTITSGAAAGATGSILFKGTTSGTVTLSVADAAGTWTMKLPVDAGTNNFVLKTDGSGVTSWVAQSGGSGITVGATTITSGTATRLLYETSGNVVGEVSGATSDGTTLTLVAPVLGSATATSINKVAITAPATGATLTLIDGTTLTGPAASGTAMTLGNAETVTGVKTLTAAAPQLILGVNTTTLGSLKLFGSTSGDVTVKAAAVAGTATVFQLPATNGSNTNVLQTDGTGVTSWVAAGGSSGITIDTTTITGGTTTRLLYDNAGTVGETSTLTYASSILTNTGRSIVSTNGAASAPPSSLTGSWFTGGSATTTKPQFLVEASGATTTGWSTAGTGLGVNAASGFTGNLLDLQLNGLTVLKVSSADRLTFSAASGGPFLWSVANALVFGLGVTNFTAAITTQSLELINTANFVWSSDNNPTTAPDLFVGRSAAATLRLGAANVDLNANVVAQNLTTQGPLAGGTTNQAGKDFTILVSPGKGTGAGGQLILRTTPAGASGTSINAAATGLTITAPVVNMQPSVVVGNQALATTDTDGFIYIPTCAGTPTGVPTAFTGRVALVYDTTNFQFWIYDGAWKQPKTPAGAALVTWQ